ncbi:hypothetical protein PoB_003954100 [Plakobranchus ocellatus]|uniref:Uncharacterized protein n=1 Tax=Plakobranchus ocellatus TaxID=259542 RepID=A0AAV4B2H1_9GAST|nr:hypothetical protein PoB_003954100 [Plakobranchus ocellatus]
MISKRLYYTSRVQTIANILLSLTDRAIKTVLKNVTGVDQAALGEIRHNFLGKNVMVSITSASPRTRDRLARKGKEIIVSTAQRQH